jgi:hypothetical protein
MFGQLAELWGALELGACVFVTGVAPSLAELGVVVVFVVEVAASAIAVPPATTRPVTAIVAASRRME